MKTETSHAPADYEAVPADAPEELGGGTEATGPSPLWARALCGMFAIGLIIASAWLPVWEARLAAPQYPAGLSLSAGGFGVRGDIAEVNELNHYVGMQAFDTADIPELALWIPTIVLVVIGALIAAIAPWRWLRRLALTGIWVAPIGMLADVQFRLYQYGHQVKPDAAIRIDPFIPKVIGKTKVLNFTTTAFPGLAIVLLLVAAALLTFGPKLLGRLRPTNDREGR